MKNFKLVSKRRKEGYGGVGILLEEDFRYEEIDFPELGPMEVVGVKIKTLANYNANKTRTNYIQVQKTRAEFKREVRRVRRRYIADLTDKIDETTPSKHLWNIIKGIDTSLSGSPSRAGVLTLTKGRNL
ncbi:hypothetical protein quinque_013732 [Culex quinquefasciatus]